MKVHPQRPREVREWLFMNARPAPALGWGLTAIWFAGSGETCSWLSLRSQGEGCLLGHR